MSEKLKGIVKKENISTRIANIVRSSKIKKISASKKASFTLLSSLKHRVYILLSPISKV